MRWHLQGCDDAKQPFVMGVYPMLLDERCHFLAVDFDGEKWGEDAQAYCETYLRLDLPAALERSRSGNGAHVWFFFSQALPAQLARKLGSYVLTETAERRPISSLARMIVSFPIRTYFRKADSNVSWHYGEIYRALAAGGELIGTNDMWIAATALAEGHGHRRKFVCGPSQVIAPVRAGEQAINRIRQPAPARG